MNRIPGHTRRRPTSGGWKEFRTKNDNLRPVVDRAFLSRLSDGLIAVVKRDCPTCRVIVPVLDELRAAGVQLTIFSQDDPDFPPGLSPVDDSTLAASWSLQSETVPTLLRIEEHHITARTEGWQREAWERVAGVDGLGAALPASLPPGVRLPDT